MAVTNVSTGYPDDELAPGSTITVDTGTALAKVTLLNVYGISAATGQLVKIELLPPALVHEPQEAPGFSPGG